MGKIRQMFPIITQSSITQLCGLLIYPGAKKNSIQYSVKPIKIDHSLTHWGRVTHICVSNLTMIGSDNGLAPTRHQAIIWTIAEMLSIGPLGVTFYVILSEILTFSFKKNEKKPICLNVSSAKWWPFCLGLNVLNQQGCTPSLVKPGSPMPNIILHTAL